MPKKPTEISSAITHIIGFGLAVAALTILVVRSALHSSAASVVGVSIFGATLVLLYSASTLYHAFPPGSRAKKIFYRLDHSMIYILIAGTYTPLTFLLNSRGWGWSLFGVIWALAVLGVIIKSFAIKAPEWLLTSQYLIMGWLVLIALSPVMNTFSKTALIWLFLGGASYTIGVIFYALGEKFPRQHWFDYHDIFHIFVVAGSICHFWFVFGSL